MKTPIDRMMDTVDWVPLPARDAGNDAGGVPYATHHGVLSIVEFSFRCYQLNDGRRVLDCDDVAKFFDGRVAL